ncbi:hypothetical protein HHI36_003399 [Cryptolaemus montrouzieri]|uniref:Uncharacterized protein n=1 Tax=Cryptolaemus montrouzieri TaxID=559131 RepID=A0ABD2PE24_9CUCU
MCASCCPQEEYGYYSNFAGNVEYHMDEKWFNVRDLLRVLKRMRKLDLTHPENRHKALCWLNGMECLAPYGPECRFPCKDFYVTEARGCWGETLNQLKQNLANNCLVKFEVGRNSRCGKKYKKSCIKEKPDCEGNKKCCSEEPCIAPPEPECCSPQCKPENQCPITSEECEKCNGPDPPSCCPEWCGIPKVKVIRPESYKCYIKTFNDQILKMIRAIERRDCVFTRKSFESHYRVIWTKYKGKCDILEESDSEEYVCDECCQKENQQRVPCRNNNNYTQEDDQEDYYNYQ